MNKINGWVREQFHQDVNKAMVVRNTAMPDKDPKYRVVFSQYFEHIDVGFWLRHGEVEKYFALPIDNELYRRSATNVYVFDWDSGDSMSFNQRVVCTLSPDDMAQAIKTRQVKELNRDKKQKSDNMILLVSAIVLPIIALVAGIFVGYYLTSTGALGGLSGALGASPTPLPFPTPIQVP